MTSPRSRAAYCSSHLGTFVFQHGSTVMRSCFLLHFAENRKINGRCISPHTHTPKASADLMSPPSAQFPGFEGPQHICRKWKVYLRTKDNTDSPIVLIRWEGHFCLGLKLLHLLNSPFIPPSFLISCRWLLLLLLNCLWFSALQISLTTSPTVREEPRNVHSVYLVQHIYSSWTCP